jgi:hypothetical protein
MTQGSPIRLPLRLWFLAEVAFGLGAAASIALDPAATATNFAWPIAALPSAALIGAFYLIVAPAMVLALFAPRWEDVRVLVLPAAVFTALLLTATHLHWDKFATGTLPFQIWYASYLLPPPIFVALYLWHERHARPAGSGHALPGALRWVMIPGGALIAAEFAFRFAAPATLAGDMPWPVTPLVARVVSAFLVALGLMLVSAGVERDTRRARLVGPSLMLALPLVALQLGRFPEGIDWSHWRILSGTALLGAISTLGLLICWLGWRRSGPPRGA